MELEIDVTIKVLSDIGWIFVEVVLTAVEFHFTSDGGIQIHDVGRIRDAGWIHGGTTAILAKLKQRTHIRCEANMKNCYLHSPGNVLLHIRPAD